MPITCEICHRLFGSQEALQQHIRDLPSHSTAFDCKDCDRVFKTEGALQQHIRDSSTHSATFDCTECRRNFKTEEALQQHTRDSPAHPTVFNCSECSRVFRTEEALQQHIRDSPVHPTRFDCNECSRVFRTQGALQQHVRDSPSHADDENSERGTQSFDMRPSLHCEVNELLQQYGLSFTFSPIDDSHEFLNEHDTSIMGKFNCTKTSCAKLRWTSKQIAITIRQLSGFRYNARIYHQQCELCRTISRPELDKSYAERVSYRLAKWSGVAVQEPPKSGHSRRPHQSTLCEGCRHGRCRQSQFGASQPSIDGQSV